MRESINYIALSTIYMAVFYMFYIIVLSRDTSYSRNRYYLLTALIFSLIMPLVKFNLPGNSGLVALSRGISEVVNIGEVKVINGGNGLISFNQVPPLAAIYLTGVTASIVLLIFNLRLLKKKIRESGQQERGLIFTDLGGIAGFTALGYIFVGNHLEHDDVIRVTNHERKHLEYKHFYDIALVRAISILFWFNPLVYLFERSLRAVHEFQVDDNLLKNGETVKDYQELMLNQLFSTNIFSVRSAFSGQTLIKKRMIMMTKKKSGKIAELKVLCLLPAIALLMVVFSCKSEKSEPEIKAIDEVVVVAKEDPAATAKPVPEIAQVTSEELEKIIEEKEVFNVVEDMPTFQGGDINKFRQWVQMNVKYPKDAVENGIQGKVYVWFLLNKEGKVEDARVLRGVDPSLDEEALKIVKSSPQWVAGKQSGEYVNVAMSMTINFQLQ